MKTIASVHIKGGTGKTTACVNIAGCLVKQQKKVLVVDLDPQGSATSSLGLSLNQDSSVYHVLMGEEAISQCIFETESGIYLLPSAIDLLVIEGRLGQSISQAHLLKNHLAKIAHHFDAILIDTPAGHTSLIVNAFLAADGHIIIPMDSGVFAYDSLEIFNTFINELAEAYHVPIHLMAVLLRNNFSPSIQKPSKTLWKVIAKRWQKNKDSTNLVQTEAVLPYSPHADIAQFWEEKGVEVKIYTLPYADEVLQSQIKGMPITHYAPESDITKVYQQITTELTIF